MRLPFRSEGIVYQIPYATEEQVGAIKKRLVELSGIYQQPIHTSGVRSGVNGGHERLVSYERVEHTWTTKEVPYIQLEQAALKDYIPTKTLVVKSNVVTPEMIEQVQVELGFIKAA